VKEIKRKLVRYLICMKTQGKGTMGGVWNPEGMEAGKVRIWPYGPPDRYSTVKL
jgi:hypothetical protein